MSDRISSNRLPGRLLAALLVAWLAALSSACHGQPAGQPPASGITATPETADRAADSTFARLVAGLSEPGGYFDTDNLISNERSYQHVLGALRERDVTGGAYIGVGPDQNFTYIAQIRPEIAFIIDIRRDNLLQHVFFKALFGLARNRLDYLCLLFGRRAPVDLAAWDDRTIEELVAYVEAAPVAIEAARTAVRAEAARAGLPLTEADLVTIEHIHRSFLNAGLDLQFSSHGRSPNAYYPTYRQLLLENDLTGRHGSYLAGEDDFQYVKRMEARNLIVPVVGDLAGEHALAAIGRYLAAHGQRVSAFYTSNIEFYLMRQGEFDRFAENVRALPRDARSMMVRSYFNRWTSSHPQTVPGYASTQLLQTIDSFVAEYDDGGYRSYWDLITKHLIAPR